MPKLSEYLGGLVSEIASARQLADLQTVQIAKEYAKDDLLKHFSIPRMKIGTVDLTVPFAKAGNAFPKIFREFAYEEIISIAKTDYNAADAKNDQRLRTFLIETEVEYDDVLKRIQSENTSKISDLQVQYFEFLPKNILAFCERLENFNWTQTDPKTFQKNMESRIISEARKVIEKTEDTEIIVEASKLMQLNPNCLVFAKMSISEAGMEWSRYENINGEIVETLIPE